MEPTNDWMKSLFLEHGFNKKSPVIPKNISIMQLEEDLIAYGASLCLNLC